jgi:outer membrane protein assembly factor BamA
MLVDRTDVPLSPTSGYTARAELEHASQATVSDYSYNRLYGEGTVYMRMGGRTSVLAGHLRVGFVRPYAGNTGEAVLHPRKRFYAGVSQSVRGYGENQLGPRALTIPASKMATLVGCDPSYATIAQCDPNGPSVATRDTSGFPATFGTLAARDFTPRPLGGTSLIEGSVELRFPIWRQIGGAAFVDGGLVGASRLGDLAKGNGAVTPGVGIRYKSPVGPIRVDIGYNPVVGDSLPVYTERINAQGKSEIVRLEKRYWYEPATSFFDRLTFHFSIGQAF